MMTMPKIILLAVLLSACGESPPDPYRVRYDKVCDEKVRAHLQSWVLTCIKNANPHSGEEDPENRVRACEYTGRRLFCAQSPVIHQGRERLMPCSEALSHVAHAAGCPKE